MKIKINWRVLYQVITTIIIKDISNIEHNVQVDKLDRIRDDNSKLLASSLFQLPLFIFHSFSNT